MMTVSHMTMPPSIAVGFLCQRSVFGTATMPLRRANARTRGVSNKAKTNEVATATATNIRGLKGIAHRSEFCGIRVTRRRGGGHSDNRLRSQGYHPGSFVAESQPAR